MLKTTDTLNLKDIFNFQLSFQAPYFFEVNFEDWKKSFMNDTDGEGRILFKNLVVKSVYENNELLGFIQYGKTAFGFDGNGSASTEISYSIIRSLYFKDNRKDVGTLLLNEAIKSFNSEERIYAFFHYFGMSCFARHGKLFENNVNIESFLIENGFKIEHENVYYSSVLNSERNSDVRIKPSDLTVGNQQYIDFIVNENQVGGCEVHYLNNSTVYLRWIYINGEMVGKGLGSKCMNALKSYLYEQNFKRLDTDTAEDNLVAQHYYEKNDFKREGITKSYFLN